MFLINFGILSVTDSAGQRLKVSMLSQLKKPADAETERIGQARAGCPEAIEFLVRRYHRDLRQFLIRRTGNRMMAEDLAQDVLVTALQQLEQLQDPTAFKSWLFAMARNKAVDSLRKLSRERKNNRELLEFMLTRQSISMIHQTEISDSPAIREALQLCIESLPPRSRELLQAFYFESESAESIAAARSQKSASIRMALMRIRRSLANCIRQRTGLEQL